MKRNFLAGALVGVAMVGVPLCYVVLDTNSLEVDSSKSSVVMLDSTVGVKGANPSAVADYLYRPDVGPAQIGLMKADIDIFSPVGEDLPKQGLTPEIEALPKLGPIEQPDDFKSKVREAIKSDPSIVVDAIVANPQSVLDALNNHMQKQQVDAEKNRDAKTLGFAEALTASEGYPLIGTKDAPVEIAYYFDVNCHYCKEMEPKLSKFVKDFPDTKIVMREFPILAESSRYAAEVAGILWEVSPEHYERFHVDLMSLPPGMSNDDINASLRNIAGMETADKIIAAATDPKSNPLAQKVAAAVATTMKTATDAGVTGTPFVMVKDSGIFLRGAAKDAYAQLQSMRQIARANHAVSAAQPSK